MCKIMDFDPPRLMFWGIITNAGIEEGIWHWFMVLLHTYDFGILSFQPYSDRIGICGWCIKRCSVTPLVSFGFEYFPERGSCSKKIFPRFTQSLYQDPLVHSSNILIHCGASAVGSAGKSATLARDRLRVNVGARKKGQGSLSSVELFRYGTWTYSVGKGQKRVW